MVSRLLTRHGNRVGAIFYGNQVDRVVPARGGRRHVLHLINSMMAPRAVKTSTTTDIGALLSAALQIVPRRSLVFVVSDFLCQPGWGPALRNLAHRHEVLGVRLYDPLEMELPNLGMIVMQDAETGEQLFVDTNDAGFRRRFASQAGAREERLQGEFFRRPASTRSNLPPTSRWSRQCCASPRCARCATVSPAASRSPAPDPPPNWCRDHELHLA